MRLRNYFPVYFNLAPVTTDSNGNPIRLDDHGSPIFDELPEGITMIGNVYDAEEYEDGEPIITSEISYLSEKAMSTREGDYELESPNADYVDMLRAIANGCPVLCEWNLEQCKLLDEVPDFKVSLEEFADQMKNIGKHDGYSFTGTVLNDPGETVIGGEVVSQDGNYVTLQVADTDGTTVSEQKYFVYWIWMGPIVKYAMQFELPIAGIETRDLETAFSFECRPNLADFLSK